MNINEVRVLHISKYYYPFLGGTEQVARDMVNVFKGANIKQAVICFNEDAKDDEITCDHRITKVDVIDDIRIYRCGYLINISSQAISFSYAKVLEKLINDFKPNLVILHYPNPFVTHFLLKYKNQQFKLLVYWHLDITKQKILKKLFKKQNIELIKRADKILGATPKHLNESEFTPYFGEKKYILPYMIDEKKLVISNEEIEMARKIKDKYNGKMLCFFIGRHVPYKGLTYLIKASRELDEDNIHFIIAGNGELTESLKEEAKGDKKIEFVGRVTDSERRAYYYASDVICFPSITRNEGFGLALAEGMYYGHPAVTFSIEGSGVNYVSIDGETGIECPNRDYKKYAMALKKLYEDKDLRDRLGRSAKQRVEDKFTANSFNANLLELIGEL